MYASIYMKGVLRKIVINSFSLWLTMLLAAGFIVEGGIKTFIIGGFVLFLIQNLVKPVLQVLTLPLNFATFGLVSAVLNVLSLYLLTIVIREISIVPFTFQGFAFTDFVVPKMDFNLLGSFVIIALTLTLIQKAFKWLLK